MTCSFEREETEASRCSGSLRDIRPLGAVLVSAASRHASMSSAGTEERVWTLAHLCSELELNPHVLSFSALNVTNDGLHALPGICASLCSCQCPLGWKGALCSETVSVCDAEHTPPPRCARGATCIPLPNGYTCLCPLGTAGLHCHKGHIIEPNVYHYVSCCVFKEPVWRVW